MVGRLLKLGSKRLGEIPAPGEQIVMLPEGKVKLRYEEDREGRSARVGAGTGTPFSGPPRGLEVLVRRADDGQPIEVMPARGSQRGAGGGRIWSAYGKVQVPEAGEYAVVVSPFEDTAPVERFNPRIVVLA
jgi:hypothetical protein